MHKIYNKHVCNIYICNVYIYIYDYIFIQCFRPTTATALVWGREEEYGIEWHGRSRERNIEKPSTSIENHIAFSIIWSLFGPFLDLCFDHLGGLEGAWGALGRQSARMLKIDFLGSIMAIILPRALECSKSTSWERFRP